MLRQDPLRTIVQPHSVDWLVSDRPVDYPVALDVMSRRVALIREGRVNELIWLLEHPPLYTAGTGARDGDLIDPGRLPCFRTGRGGQFTYHGPGQRVIYVMLDLKRRELDVRGLVTRLEAWAVDVLAQFNIKGEVRRDRVGVWVRRATATGFTESKIAAIGLRVSRSISSHGVSLNVNPNLSYYDGIIPCGIRDSGVTSLADLGLPVTLYDVDVALRKTFQNAFGPAKLVESSDFSEASLAKTT